MWRAVQQGERGVFRDTSGDWAYKHLTPRQDMNLAGVPGLLDDGALGMRLVVHVDRNAALQATWRWKLVLALILVTALAVTLRLAWQTARNMAARKAHEDALQSANSALRLANDQLRTVQTELARADRLSSLGLMVAGVAHELNTPLGSATLALSTVQQRLDMLALLVKQGLRKSDLEDYVASSHQALGVVLTSLKRSAGIVQRFKQVAVDRTTMEQRGFDLAEIILDADPRLRKWDPSHPVQLKLDVAPDLTMLSYPGPLEQVVANLLDNALSHAFVDRPGGAITLRAMADGPDHVCIWFSDDGVGVSEESLARIFDPFYTTRRHAGGTGLGLHIVYQLVHDVLGGSIEAANVPEGGMVFTLRLPRKAPLKKPSSAISPALLPLVEPPRQP
jgi:signal transduction histidine kinase